MSGKGRVTVPLELGDGQVALSHNGLEDALVHHMTVGEMVAKVVPTNR